MTMTWPRITQTIFDSLDACKHLPQEYQIETKERRYTFQCSKAISRFVQHPQRYKPPGMEKDDRMRGIGFAIAFLLLFPNISSVTPAYTNPAFQPQISKAVDYLTKRFNLTIDLIYESDDPGKHWLTAEFEDFKWLYRQTYWLYSDNLFAAYALEPFRPDLSVRIRSALRRYRIPPSDLFEVVVGDQIPMIRNAVDYMVESSSEHVVMARRHDSLVISYGLYADLICYRALQFFLQGRTREAYRSFQQAISLWSGKGLDDWSFTMVDGFYSNQKLALLLYTSRILMMSFAAFNDMENHLWSMQRSDGGLAALSNGEGMPMGSPNTETTALALLIYNESLIRSVRSKALVRDGLLSSFGLSLLLLVTIVSFSVCRRSRSRRLHASES